MVPRAARQRRGRLRRGLEGGPEEVDGGLEEAGVSGREQGAGVPGGRREADGGGGGGSRPEEASREGRRRRLLQWPRRASRGGGKGDRRGGGGAGRPKKPLRPPPQPRRETLEDWGGRAPGGWRHAEGGPGAQGETQRKPSHWGECPSRCVSGAGGRWGRQGRRDGGGRGRRGGRPRRRRSGWGWLRAGSGRDGHRGGGERDAAAVWTWGGRYRALTARGASRSGGSRALNPGPLGLRGL